MTKSAEYFEKQLTKTSPDGYKVRLLLDDDKCCYFLSYNPDYKGLIMGPPNILVCYKDKPDIVESYASFEFAAEVYEKAQKKLKTNNEALDQKSKEE